MSPFWAVAFTLALTAQGEFVLSADGQERVAEPMAKEETKPPWCMPYTGPWFCIDPGDVTDPGTFSIESATICIGGTMGNPPIINTVFRNGKQGYNWTHEDCSTGTFTDEFTFSQVVLWTPEGGPSANGEFTQLGSYDFGAAVEGMPQGIISFPCGDYVGPQDVGTFTVTVVCPTEQNIYVDDTLCPGGTGAYFVYCSNCANNLYGCEVVTNVGPLACGGPLEPSYGVFQFDWYEECFYGEGDTFGYESTPPLAKWNAHGDCTNVVRQTLCLGLNPDYDWLTNNAPCHFSHTMTLSVTKTNCCIDQLLHGPHGTAITTVQNGVSGDTDVCIW